MKKILALCCFLLGYAFSQVYESSGITVVGKRLYDGSLQTGYYGAAQVITSADIQAAGALTVPDVLQKYGIAKYSNATGSPLDWTLNWNGFSKGQEIVVIVDGVKVNEADQNDVYWTNIPAADIERLEIIPGAGSAQYGSGAFAGVLNIVTNKSPQKSVLAEIGTDGFGRQGFTLGDTFAENFYYRLDFDNLAATGQRKHSAYRDQRLSGKLGWFNAGSELNFYYKLADAQANYPDQLTAEEILDNRRQAIAPDGREIKTDQANLEYLGQLGDWAYSLSLGARARNVKYTTVSRGAAKNTTLIKADENDTSYLGQITYKNKFTLGYDYRLSDIRSRDYGYVNYVQHPLHKKITDTQAFKKESAPYFQYFDKWQQIYWRYGAREDRVDYTQSDKLNKSAPQKEKSFSKRAHNGELGWNFIPDWQVYYSYGEAFKAPAFYSLFHNSGGYVGNENLNSELAKTQTAGLRWQNVFTNFNWNVFQTIVEDEIIGVFNPTSFMHVNQNAQETRRDGFNLNLEQKLNAEWQVFANYNYVKARFVEGYISYSDQSLSGYSIPLTPEQTYGFGFNYEQDKFSLNLAQNFVDKQYADDYFVPEGDSYYSGDTSSNLLPAYTFADLRAAYRPAADWQMYLFVHNLFNNRYSTKSLVGFSTVDGITDYYEFYTPADLRSAAVGAQWLF